MFKVNFINLGYSADQKFTTLKEAFAYGVKHHFEFSVSDQYGIVSAWSPISGRRDYRAIVNCELTYNTD